MRHFVLRRDSQNVSKPHKTHIFASREVSTPGHTTISLPARSFSHVMMDMEASESCTEWYLRLNCIFKRLATMLSRTLPCSGPRRERPRLIIMARKNNIASGSAAAAFASLQGAGHLVRSMRSPESIAGQCPNSTMAGFGLEGWPVLSRPADSSIPRGLRWRTCRAHA